MRFNGYSFTRQISLRMVRLIQLFKIRINKQKCQFSEQNDEIIENESLVFSKLICLIYKS